jgi:hypothetical protein
MSEHNFTLILDGDLREDSFDALFHAGCDDAMFGTRSGLTTAEFDRKAASFASAVLSAIRDVESADLGLRVIRVEPDDLVSLSAIAQRTGRTRQSIGALQRGVRGPGDFPAPLAHIDGKNRLWQWSAVERWLAERLKQPAHLGGAPQFVSALNGVLQARTAIADIGALAEVSRREDQPEEFAISIDELRELPVMVDAAATAVADELAHV